MTQTYRTDDFARWGAGQGFNLTAAQVDINFWDLVQRMIAQEARPDPSAGIAYFEIVGVMMFVHMTDGTVLGPYELPVAIFHDRGIWAPSTFYAKMDTFSQNGGLYVVIFDHTSGTTFNPDAGDGAGHNYYQLMIQTPGSALPSGGAPGTMLLKATTTDYSVMWGMPDASKVVFVPATGSTLSSFNVADALEEAALSSVASNVSYTPPTGSSLTSDNVQDALDELDAAIGSATGGAGAGRQTIWIPATAMIPLMTNGAVSNKIEMPTYKNVVATLDFDPDTVQYVQFDVAFPKSWDGSDFSFKLYWSHVTPISNFDVVFSLDCVQLANNIPLDNSPDDDVSLTTSGFNENRLCISDESGTMNPGGNGGDIMQFRLSRSATDSADTLEVPARVHGIQLYYNTTSATDD